MLKLIKICTAKNKILEEEYLIKSIRADELNYFRIYSKMITPSAAEITKIPLRLYKKKAFIVNGHGVFKHWDKPSRFTNAEKKGFSQSNSTTLVTREVTPPLFGFNRDRRDKLVGIRIGLCDALLTERLFIYDGGTVGRPYHHDTQESAEQYHKDKVTCKNPILYAYLDDFKKAIANARNAGNYNEVLARIRWSTDVNNQIIIGSDSLEARLLAQDYARIMLNRLNAQAAENHQTLNPHYYIPICFYNVKNHDNLEIYNLFDQASDRNLAENIYLCKKERYYNYEFKKLRIFIVTQ